MKKNIKRLICIMLTVAILFSLTGCVETNLPKSDYSGLNEVDFDENMLAMAGYYSDEMADFFNNNWGIDVFTKLEPDGENQLHIYYSDGQKDKIQELIKEEIEGATEEFGSINERDYAEVSESLDSYVIHLTMGFSEETLNNYLRRVEFYSYFNQMMNGTKDGDCLVYFDIYNADTGKLLVETTSADGFDITGNDWDASYDEEDLKFTIGSDFAGDFGWNNDRLKDYLEDYRDCFVTLEKSEDTGKIALIVSDPELFVTMLRDRLALRQKDFAGIGDGYKIDIDEDYTTLNVYYDSIVSDQTVEEDIVLTVLDARMYYLITKVDFDGWTLNYNIYNSSTGELAMSLVLPEDDFSYITQNEWK